MNVPTNDSWVPELQTITELMKQVSRTSDPLEAGRIYSKGLREGLLPSDEWLAVSRRDLPAPQYRITRSTRWDEQPNPWKEKNRLPVFDRGLLGELLYSNEPAVITDLQSRLSKDDPAYDYLCRATLLVTLPQYDNGEALNMPVVLVIDPEKMNYGGPFPFDRIPMMVWQANLFGRSVLNMVLRQELLSAYEALDRELRTVGELQRSLLPRELPEVPGHDLAAYYRTSQRAGGDYYDLFPLSDGRVGIFMADVSGHGSPAAVLMAVTHALAHSHPGQPSPPASVLVELNRKLTRMYTTEGAFVTAFYGVYNAATGVLEYASAGHNPPRLVQSKGVVSLESHSGLPLGVMEDGEFGESTVRIERGDVLVLYTDGITEAFSPEPDRRLWGVEALDTLLMAQGDRSSKSVVDAVVASVEKHTAGGAPTDDRTLLVMHRQA